MIIDCSLLHVKEYNDINERNYSFHWQKSNGELIIRWDNAPHHKHLENYPHHKHTADRVEESKEITLQESNKIY